MCIIYLYVLLKHTITFSKPYPIPPPIVFNNTSSTLGIPTPKRYCKNSIVVDVNMIKNITT
ncbi:hypothetical protein BC30048_0758 [Bacillus cereus]|nr:hypothetical protein BCJMU10_0777 [Bacillus cereus]BCC97855.1 hypothetical protein BC30048_0758 [Bacillus cereus]